VQLASQEIESSTTEELSRKLNLILKRLDTLEAIVLENPEYAELATFFRLTRASVGLYADPLRMVTDSQTAKQLAKSKLRPSIQAKLILRSKEVNVGEDVNLEMQLTNEGEASALLIRVEKILPEGFELVAKPSYCRFEETYLDMNRKRLDPLMTEEIRLALRSFDKEHLQ